MRTVVISQPTYMPWLGYFRIMKEADIFVFLDHVQFERRSWQCRNRIKAPKKWIWLTVPTLHEGRCSIKDVKIDNTKPWQRQHWNALRVCYGKAPYFNLYSPFFKSVYEKNWTKLVTLNIYIIKYLACQLGLSPVFLKSSELKVRGRRTRMLLNICKMLGANRYVSSIGAREYMIEDDAEELFEKEGVKVEFLEYNHPEYPQLFGNFISHLSFIDCLFNCGPDSAKIVFSKESAIFQSFSLKT
jgi:hypothetical protein